MADRAGSRAARLAGGPLVGVRWENSATMEDLLPDHTVQRVITSFRSDPIASSTGATRRSVTSSISSQPTTVLAQPGSPASSPRSVSRAVACSIASGDHARVLV